MYLTNHKGIQDPHAEKCTIFENHLESRKKIEHVARYSNTLHGWLISIDISLPFLAKVYTHYFNPFVPTVKVGHLCQLTHKWVNWLCNITANLEASVVHIKKKIHKKIDTQRNSNIFKIYIYRAKIELKIYTYRAFVAIPAARILTTDWLI